MSETTRQRLLGALKKHAPARLRATLTDDTVKDIAVSRGRVKWAPVVELLGDLAWSRVELLDAKGGLLSVVDNDAPATDLETVGGASSGSTRAAEVGHLLGLMLRAQDMALQRHTEALKPTLEALRTTVKDLTEQAMTWRKEAQRADARADARVDAMAAQLHKLIAAKEEGDEKSWMDAIGELSRAAPALFQLAGAAGLLPKPAAAVGAAAARPSVPRPPSVAG